MAQHEPIDDLWPLDIPCDKCGDDVGLVQRGPIHIKLVCAGCGAYQKFLSKSDLGEQPRSLTPRGECIKPKQRARILVRDGGRCMLCGGTENLTAGHILSHADGLDHGLDEDLIDSDDNLMCMCERCNSGLGRSSLPLYLAEALIARRRPQEDR